jgi:hypothetical protein
MLAQVKLLNSLFDSWGWEHHAKKYHEGRFSTNLILKDEIEKKSILKKDLKKKNVN